MINGLARTQPNILITAACCFAAWTASVGIASAQSSPAALSQGRSHLASAASGNIAVFAGGRVGTVPSNVVDIYDGASNTWTTALLSQPRYLLAGGAVGTQFVFAGGYENLVSNAVDIYDTSSGTWSTSTLFESKYSIATVSHQGRLYLAGGRTCCVSSNRVDIFDGTTWSTAQLSEGRHDLAAAAVGDKVIFAGGRQDCCVSDVVDIYDAPTGQWTVAHLSQARYGLAATAVGTKALFAGGYDAISGGGVVDVVDIYDAQTGLWSTASLSSASYNLQASSAGSIALFAGGLPLSPVVDAYDATTGSWSTSTLSVPRTDMAATSIGDTAIFAGGSDTNVVDFYFASGLPDCNGNGVPDPTDLSQGTSNDFDSNGVPDECRCTATHFYCEGGINSLGKKAAIGYEDETSITLNQLILTVKDARPGQIGIFFIGSFKTQVPFGDGLLCITGNIGRLTPPVFLDGQGAGALVVDFTDQGSPISAVLPLSEWNLQFWYRDPQLVGNQFNLSNAVHMQFCP